MINIDNQIKEYKKSREDLLELLFKAETVEDKENALKVIEDLRLLPLNDYVSMAPNELLHFWDSNPESFTKYMCVTYLDWINYMLEDYCDSDPHMLELYDKYSDKHPKYLEEIDKFYNPLVEIVWKYVKSTRTIGTEVNW